MSVTERLVDHSLWVEYEALPQGVVDATKLHILDTIGCALGGSVTKLGRSILRMIEESCSTPDSTVIGDGTRIPCKDAAFINGTLANALDYEDTGPGHPASTIVPSALAVGEKVKASGKDLLEAVVAAYDVDVRIGMAIRPSKDRYQKVWGVGVSQAFGGAVAAGRLLGLGRKEMLNAFGIAGAASPLPSAMKWGFEVKPLTWVKDSVAQAAIAGVMGALMAKHGFLGCQDILDGERGFWIMAGSDRCDFDMMVKGLGEEYSIVDVSFKPYSSCRFTHSTLDALSQVISEHGVEADDVREIVVKSFWDLTELFDDYTPKEIVDGQFSIPYTVSMIMLGIPTGPEWYKDELMRDQKVLNFSRKVRIETDPEADRLYHESGDGAMPSTVELTTIDDRRFNAYVPYPSGHPKNPITVPQVKNKFENLASHVLDDSKIKEILATVDHLEKLRDINDLTRLLF